MIRVPVLAIIAGLAFPGASLAQGSPTPRQEWAAAAALYPYLVPGESPLLNPVLAADRGMLHLEGRYNYEDPDALSVWVGYNWAFDGEVQVHLTPMAGVVLGPEAGVAPGLEADVSWGWLEWYTEAEWVFDLGDRSQSFFYAWTEITLAPADWVQVGSVNQRTRLWRTDRAIQPGALLRFASDGAGVTLHVFNPDSADPTWVFAMSWSH